MAMVMKAYEYEIPCIYLYYEEGLNDESLFNEILWGIEEEGIPFKVESLQVNNSCELSHLGATKSKLVVGIGIDKNGIITLTHNKLEKDKPLFTANLKDDGTVLRKLGANAGRLVKGIAFK
ncbi:glycerol dehydratase reactivase beta/small subunit family protein [Clostridium baratii]|uniref:glycerol dehydratase reactivase beta/small subunit family protein n=1 Tax=Clostridium baratii TaxID=1561 RepID=UPI002910CEBA|nr:glycerol dehydratase reactivase beta/small subunit family protein [Clostridium baratii]MDU4910834.1 glycerol dehydratase reactivase beta/small subunit family protein [Clostridium baratii]